MEGAVVLLAVRERDLVRAGRIGHLNCRCESRHTCFSSSIMI